jgi:hypothetical protein
MNIKPVNYAIDLVLCVDKTGGMLPIIPTLQQDAERLPDDLNNIFHRGQSERAAGSFSRAK